MAALQPSIFSGYGRSEFTRFRKGAASRNELALVVSSVGADDDRGTGAGSSAFYQPLLVGDSLTSIGGRLLGRGTRVEMCEGLSDPDRDLALRLLSQQPSLNWRILGLNGATTESIFGDEKAKPPEGTIRPIVTTSLGEPVAGVWASEDECERRYLVPAGTPWESIVAWLAQRAIPEYVPDAMRRVRSHLAWPPQLLTQREHQAEAALAHLTTSYTEAKRTLESDLARANEDAEPIRVGLLYSTGHDLVNAVHSVLTAAGLEVVDLDESLGDTRSADLLCSYRGLARLVEVKAAAGSPGERLYDDLMRHLRLWPSLPDAGRIDGGALVLNHEHKKDPLERTREPYLRREFLDAQTQPVITTWSLFEAWRDQDWPWIRSALFPPSVGASNQVHDETEPNDAATEEAPQVERRWSRLRKSDGGGDGAIRKRR